MSKKIFYITIQIIFIILLFIIVSKLNNFVYALPSCASIGRECPPGGKACGINETQCLAGGCVWSGYDQCQEGMDVCCWTRCNPSCPDGTSGSCTSPNDCDPVPVVCNACGNGGTCWRPKSTVGKCKHNVCFWDCDHPTCTTKEDDAINGSCSSFTNECPDGGASSCRRCASTPTPVPVATVTPTSTPTNTPTPTTIPTRTPTPTTCPKPSCSIIIDRACYVAPNYKVNFTLNSPGATDFKYWNEGVFPEPTFAPYRNNPTTITNWTLNGLNPATVWARFSNACGLSGYCNNSIPACNIPTSTPTSTPRPTATPIIVPTFSLTPRPTSTPVPTSSPRPTATPVATRTPTPRPKSYAAVAFPNQAQRQSSINRLSEAMTWICLKADRGDVNNYGQAKLHGEGFPVSNYTNKINIYIVGCVQINGNFSCTTGRNSQGQNYDTTLGIGPYNENIYRLTMGTNPVTTTNGNIDVTVNSVTPNNVTTHVFYGVFSSAAATTPGGFASLQYATFTGTTDFSKCISIRWDPYGRVFDSQTLKPIEKIKIYLLDENKNKVILPGLINPVITDKNGYYNFLVEENKYYLKIDLPEGYVFIDKPELNPNYKNYYSNLYFPNQLIVETINSSHQYDIALTSIVITH